MQYLNADDVRQRLPMPALIEALRQRFAQGCAVPLRHTHTISDPNGAPAGTVLIMPAWRCGGRFGVKTVNIFPGNAARGLPALHASYMLFDATTGQPLALLDGSELTTRRTAAASALAASYLARPDAGCLLVVGAGRVARVLPEAMRCARPSLRRFLVWNHRADAAARLVATLRDEGLEAQAEGDLEAAVGVADIISCATLSRAPLVRGRWLAAGAHLDLIGSFTPDMRESDGECWRLARAWVDTDEALAKAGDVLQAMAEGAFEPGRVQGRLSDLCRGAAVDRRPGDRTLFKSVGTALEDLAAAELAIDGLGGESA